MSDDVRFNVLGRLEVVVGGRRFVVPAGKQRILLATLLLSANDVVTVEELIDRLWGDAPPRAPRGALQTYLTRLRAMLDDCADGFSRCLHTCVAGYRLKIPPECLDLSQFRLLAERARRADERNDPAAEVANLGQALALWRGPVLPDVPSDSLHREVVAGVTEEWLRLLERRFEVGLVLGRQDELIGDLRTLTRRFAFRERLWQQLMLALYRSGRQVEALEAYREVRGRLRDELGIDPGEDLRRLHVAILRRDSGLLASSGGVRGRG